VILIYFFFWGTDVVKFSEKKRNRFKAQPFLEMTKRAEISKNQRTTYGLAQSSPHFFYVEALKIKNEDWNERF